MQPNRSARHRRPGVGGMLLTILLLSFAAGCTSSETSTSTSESTAAPQVAGQATTQAAARTGTAQPAAVARRTIIDATGKQVEVPGTPQRVLAVSEPDLDAALALGLKPVGTVNGRGQQSAPRYLGERVAGIPIVGNINQPDIEKALALRPDLILAGSYTDEQTLARLRQVAPTVVTFNTGEDWKTQLTRAGAAMNREQQAAAFIAEYDRRVQEVKARLGPNADAVVSITRWNPQGPGYMLNDSFASRVVGDLGLKRPASQQQPGASHAQPLSLEALNQIDADWLFVGTLNAEGDDVRALEAAKNTPNFKQLNAVKNNHLVAVDGSLWTSLGDALAAMAVLDDVQKAMAAR